MGTVTTSETWNGNSDNWETAADWSGGVVPGSSTAVTISSGNPQVISNVGEVASVTDQSNLALDDGALQTSGDFDNSGTLQVDNYYGQDGSSLTIGGALVNSSYVEIGNGGLSATTTVTAGSLNNTGNLYITGSGTNEALLNVLSAAPSAWSGVAYLAGDAQIDFAGGAIATIAFNTIINETGLGAQVDLAGGATANSALTTLASNAGQLVLQNGSTLATSTGLNNSGALDLDPYYGQGGSSLKIGGTLTNSGSVQIGNSGLDANTTLTATGLSNSNVLTLYGNGPYQGLLNITSAASSTWTGVAKLTGDAQIDFTGGAITAIGANAQINEVDLAAQVDITGGSAPNSALTTLASDAGQLLLQNGSTLTTTTGLTNSGNVDMDIYYGQGGSSLNIGGMLTNSYDVQIGNSGLDANTTLTASGLDNTGTLTLDGDAPYEALLNVTSAAPSTWTGVANLNGDAQIDFTGGAITAIGSIPRSTKPDSPHRSILPEAWSPIAP